MVYTGVCAPLDRQDLVDAQAVSNRPEPLGAMLLQRNFITAEQLKAAIEQQKLTGRRLGNVLVSMGFTTPDAVLGVLSLQLGVPAVRLNGYTVHPDAVSTLAEKVARKHLAFPLLKVGSTLKVAIASPKDLSALDDIRFASGCRIETVVALEDEIREAFDRYYAADSATTENGTACDLIVVEGPVTETRDATQPDRRRPGAGRRITDLMLADRGVQDPETERSAVRIVERILIRGIGEHASDIHFEPMEEILRVRCRVDGTFRDVAYLSTDIAPAIVARLKVLARMDIAEHRVPQDGRFSVLSSGQPLDLRASTYPTVFGEKVVLRLLDHADFALSIDRIGMPEQVLSTFTELIHRPQGMVLITGPTGSGKSSTVYAALGRLIETGRNVVTIEDPVEYAIAGANQGQTNDKAGFTFAKGLRAILRQDPDVIMVGEVRDSETLNTAIGASLTGRLVLTTLHTNSAVATVARLLEMELEPYLLTASVQGIVAQRLVRRICQHCAEAFPTPAGLRHMFPDDVPAELCRGRGCKDCRGTGYRGRIGIFELLHMTDALRDLVLARASEAKLLEAARCAGMAPLRDECLSWVRKGETTLEELVRITVAS
ncbi:MAG TPA: ATPase, T2SS/T4P/T4SS family [Vicinamibacterales bacterium]|nr:ATPase, T2SS/T4P/T4SS family [Vicinamibacterales bacterium]